MQFHIPQFIEHELKILGPLTFRQTISIWIAAAVCFVLYFTIGKLNFFIFLLISIMLIGGALMLSFLKIGGQSLPTILKNFLNFNLGSKLYIWKRKQVPIFFKPKIRKEKPKKEEKESPLKMEKMSKIKELGKKIEFGG